MAGTEWFAILRQCGYTARHAMLKSISPDWDAMRVKICHYTIMLLCRIYPAMHSTASIMEHTYGVRRTARESVNETQTERCERWCVRLMRVQINDDAGLRPALGG